MAAPAKPGFAPTKETYIAGFTLVAIAFACRAEMGQEVIDLFAMLNAVRAALPTEDLQDY